MTWDYIIIGAGSAGCALAYQLAKSGRSVLILEAGGSDRSPFIKIPAGLIHAIPRYDWGYQMEPDASRYGVAERLLRGRVLGGSSSINGTKYVRAAAVDFDRWSELCGHRGGWSADEVMPIFRDMEASDRSDPLRGRQGPLSVRTIKRPHRITRAFMEAASVAGYPFNPDYNGETQEGVAYTQFSQRRGLRCSAADAFLRPVLGRNNVELLLNAEVEKIEIANGRAAAVIFVHKGQRRREVAGDVILCAGAINSPKLLMLSGVGDAGELRKIDIDVKFDLPAVGRHLKDQPLVRATYRARIPTYNLTEGLLQKIGIAATFLVHGEGPVSNLFEAVGFLKSSAAEPAPDIRLTFLALGSSLMPDGTIKFTPYPAVSVSVMKSYPVGSGQVSLASNIPTAPPVIRYSLLGEHADVQTLIRGIQVVRGIMSQTPIASLLDGEMAPGALAQDASTLEEFVRKNSDLAQHTIGTCRMGVDSDAVVDPELRVRGIDNLWIADASIMPEHISADTNATCMMIGMKLGRQLVGRPRERR